MADSAMPAPAQWRVTAQQETTLPGASGTFTKGVQVFFTTAEGVSASVFVPDLLYTPQKVRELILTKVAALQGVSNLTG